MSRSIRSLDAIERFLWQLNVFICINVKGENTRWDQYLPAREHSLAISSSEQMKRYTTVGIGLTDFASSE